MNYKEVLEKQIEILQRMQDKATGFGSASNVTIIETSKQIQSLIELLIMRNNCTE